MIAGALARSILVLFLASYVDNLALSSCNYLASTSVSKILDHAYIIESS